MAVYWLMFSIPLLAYICNAKVGPEVRFILITQFLIIFTVLIGFRLEVGGDWNAYLKLFSYFRADAGLENYSLLHADFLYFALNMVAHKFHLGIWFVNLICGLCLIVGILFFCNQQRNFYLALLVCVPYLIIVVGMGYSRQAAAIGFSFLAIAMLNKQRPLLFLLFLFFGVLFHKSCLLIAPFGIIGLAKKGNIRVVVAVFAVIFSMVILSVEVVLMSVKNYLGVKANESSGAFIRIALSAIPALIILRYHRVILADSRIKEFWIFFSFVPLITLPLVSLASNLADRLLLYSLPIQVFCFSRLDLLFKDHITKSLVNFLVIFLYFLVLYVWLNFSYHSHFWVPYKSMLFHRMGLL